MDSDHKNPQWPILIVTYFVKIRNAYIRDNTSNIERKLGGKKLVLIYL